jgi:hypothetical protein
MPDNAPAYSIRARQKLVAWVGQSRSTSCVALVNVNAGNVVTLLKGSDMLCST